MAETRRTSARIKAEPLSKRRMSEIEAEKPKPASKRQKTPPAKNQAISKEPAVAILPTKISDSKPLPTVKEPQPSDLLDSEYQSVLERLVEVHSYWKVDCVLTVLQRSIAGLIQTIARNLDTWNPA